MNLAPSNHTFERYKLQDILNFLSTEIERGSFLFFMLA